MTSDRLGQPYCHVCNKAVGLSDQEIAYSSLLVNGWLCPRHNDAEAREMKLAAKMAHGQGGTM